MMDMPQWKRIEDADAQMRSCSRDGVTYLTFPLLDAAEGFGHAVSTRMGGVSTGWFSTLNMAPGERMTRSWSGRTTAALPPQWAMTRSGRSAARRPIR